MGQSLDTQDQTKYEMNDIYVEVLNRLTRKVIESKYKTQDVKVEDVEEEVQVKEISQKSKSVASIEETQLSDDSWMTISQTDCTVDDIKIEDQVDKNINEITNKINELQSTFLKKIEDDLKNTQSQEPEQKKMMFANIEELMHFEKLGLYKNPSESVSELSVSCSSDEEDLMNKVYTGFMYVNDNRMKMMKMN